MLSEIIEFVKDSKKFLDRNFYDIMLIIIVGSLIMLIFASGYILIKNQSKQPIQIEKQLN
jgi:hypothetical protein